MQTIRMTTIIAAPVERCFRLALNIDVEAEAFARWGLRPVGGVTHGIAGPGDRVLWKGWQFWLPRRHASVLTVVRTASFFRDVMEEGSFSSFEHDHHFATMNDRTRMRDELRFTLPLGRLGRMAEGPVRRRLEKMLLARNAHLKQIAQSGQWEHYLKPEHTSVPAATIR